MRLLVEISIPYGGSTYTRKISNEYISDLTNVWEGFITKFSGINRRIEKQYGGQISTTYGDISLSQELFESYWLPPENVGLTVWITESTEAAKVLVFVGSGQRSKITDSDVIYDLYPEENELNVLDDDYVYEETQIYIVDTPYQWNLSAGGTNEYYLSSSAGATVSPGIDEPERVIFAWETLVDKGTVGSLIVRQWGWGNNDSLGFNTAYYRDTFAPTGYSNGQLMARYSTELTSLPQAFGDVIHQVPVRMNDRLIGGIVYQAYNAGKIVANYNTRARQITSIISGGVGFSKINSPAHGFINGDTVTIEIAPHNYYNGTYIISSVLTNSFEIPKNWVSSYTGHAFKAGFYRVYDGGVPITGNVGYERSGNIYLNPAPVGEVTISGTNTNDDLTAIFTYFSGASYLNLTLNTTYDRAVSPPVAHWETEQQLLVNWLSELAAWHTHLYYITDTTLYLIDMFIDAGTETLTEFDIFEDVKYEFENTQISGVKSEWILRDWSELQGQYYIAETEEAQTAFTEKGIGNLLSVKPFHIDKDVVFSANDLIKDIYVRRNVFFTIPAEFLPTPGKRINFTDTLPVDDIIVQCRVLTLSYSFDQDSIGLQGKFIS
jgi:hypothetical protein